MRWSEDVTMKFVKLYLKQECLWNPEHPGYRIKYQRNLALNNICADFHSTTNMSIGILEVKNKIKNLRTTYMQEVNKILEKSTPDCIYEPSLVWFHEMDSCIKNLPSYRNNSYKHQDSIEADTSGIWNEQILQNASDDIKPDPLTSSMDSEYTPVVKKAKKKHWTKSALKKNKKKKNRIQKLKYLNTNERQEFKRDDEFDIYGKYIAVLLRRMGTSKAVKIQLDIQSLLNDARLSDVQ